MMKPPKRDQLELAEHRLAIVLEWRRRRWQLGPGKTITAMTDAYLQQLAIRGDVIMQTTLYRWDACYIAAGLDGLYDGRGLRQADGNATVNAFIYRVSRRLEDGLDATIGKAYAAVSAEYIAKGGSPPRLHAVYRRLRLAEQRRLNEILHPFSHRIIGRQRGMIERPSMAV